MAGERISRRKLSAYIADNLASGLPAEDVLNQAAAYLLETKQTHDVDQLVRTIEEQLMERGIVVADVASAHTLSDEAKAGIGRLLDARELHLRETVDTDLLGGFRLDVPGKRYDGTLKRKINALKSLER